MLNSENSRNFIWFGLYLPNTKWSDWNLKLIWGLLHSSLTNFGPVIPTWLPEVKVKTKHQHTSVLCFWSTLWLKYLQSSGNLIFLVSFGVNRWAGVLIWLETRLKGIFTWFSMSPDSNITGNLQQLDLLAISNSGYTVSEFNEWMQPTSISFHQWYKRYYFGPFSTWPWPWHFKWGICYILAKIGLVAMKRKANMWPSDLTLAMTLTWNS